MFDADAGMRGLLLWALPMALLLMSSCQSTKDKSMHSMERGAARASDIEAVLDDFHDAAARADSARYFAHFTDDAIFLGTDPNERWDLDQFKAFAAPHFDAGTGWTYVAISRHVSFGSAGDTAWFDERLENASYGTVRGTGALVWSAGAWKLAQYNLTFEVPNDLAKELVAKIRAAEAPAKE
ncbi:MAG: ketosteroid isomerase-like protein [Planctomycetota bacterium]|jgi:ketosteroid isomerase-like protein